MGVVFRDCSFEFFAPYDTIWLNLEKKKYKMREKRVALLRMINVAFLEYKQFTADNLAQMVRVALEVTFYFYDLI